MKLQEIAERLQADLMESPSDKPKKTRPGYELDFIQDVLGNSGHRLSTERIHTLAAEASSYENFISAATKK